jgi:hypothetical protein
VGWGVGFEGEPPQLQLRTRGPATAISSNTRFM